MRKQKVFLEDKENSDTKKYPFLQDERLAM